MAAKKTGKKSDKTRKGTKATPMSRKQLAQLLKKFDPDGIVAYRMPTKKPGKPSVPRKKGDPGPQKVQIVVVICGNTGAPRY